MDHGYIEHCRYNDHERFEQRKTTTQPDTSSLEISISITIMATTMPSPSSLQVGTSITTLNLVVASEKQIRSENDLDSSAKTSLLYILTSADCYWGNAKTIEDCSKEKFVDSGIILHKELKPAEPATTLLRFHYWQAYFGGNPTGYLLTTDQVETETSSWKILVENCDGDFIWRGPGERPLRFLNQVKKAALGRYYDAEVDVIEEWR